MNPKNEYVWPEIFTRNKLGLTHAESEDLFFPENFEFEEYSKERAVRTLRHLAYTGEVNWNLN